jgi:hypothetical protein
MRYPSPPNVSWALSGFVVGVFATLLATGIFARSPHTSAAPPVVTPRAVAPSILYTQINRLVTRQLGKYTDTRQARLVSLRLLTVRTLESLTDSSVPLAHYRSVYVRFRLNDNPLGASWRVRTAKADVFALLKTLYSSGLPVYDALLIGMYPLTTGHVTNETQAVVAYETHDDAVKIPWKQWGRENEGVVWNGLSYHSIDPRFG